MIEIINPVTLLRFVLLLLYKEKSNRDQPWQTKPFKPEPVEIVWLGYMTKDSSRNSGRTPADVPPPSALNLQQRIPQYGRRWEWETGGNHSFSIFSSR